jgi:hypothetical protein
MVARLRDKGYISNIPFLLRAIGPLRADILRDALQLVVDRHGVLRSNFAVSGDGLTQTPIDGIAVALPLIDLSDAADPLAAALSEVAADGARPFDLSVLPRLRGRIFRLGQNDHVVSLVVDHLAADGLSLAIIGAEWRSFYQAIAAGTPFEIPPITPQYRDYALWQQRWRAGPEAERLRQAWLADLDGLPPRAAGPTAAPDAAELRQFELDPRITQRLSALCVKFRVKPFAAVLACFAPLLFAATGERDLLVGTVRANRRRPETAAMVGHFANLIPLHLRIDPARQAGDWVRDVAAVCAAAHARDELPFLDLAAAAWRALRLPASRLAEFSINFVPFPGEATIWDSDLRMTQIWGLFGDRPLATSRVTLFIRQQQSRLGGTLVYDRTTIDAGWAADFPNRIGAAIEQLAADRSQTVRALLAASGSA